MSQAERDARQAHRRGLRAGHAGRPADGVRLVRAGLAALGWREDEDGMPGPQRALAARLVLTLAHLESESGRADYVPWGMLPGLRGRPVTVCPSASSWVAAWRAADGAAAPAARSPVLVAGPGLQHALPEVTSIAAVYPSSEQLVGGTATVDAALRALDGAPLAHLAAHGHHDRENVPFSRLDLADGPLMAYDVQRLSRAPAHVVLSACDVGRTVVRPGDEILGFTAALLHLGTTTVISSVSRVDDETALATMTAYHRALSTGLRPAEALALAGAHAGPADATAGGLAGGAPLAPFVYFGAG